MRIEVAKLLTPIVSAFATIAVGIFAFRLNKALRVDAHFKRVDELLTVFQTGELADARRRVGNYWFGHGGSLEGIEHEEADLHACFLVLWFFIRLAVVRVSLGYSRQLLSVRVYLDEAIRVDVEMWTEYLAIESGAKDHFKRSRRGLTELGENLLDGPVGQ